MAELSLHQQIEALLFVSGEPLEKTHLAKVLERTKVEIGTALEELRDKYQNDPMSGLMLLEHDESAELVTRSECSQVVTTFTKATLQEDLSKAALEVLAIVAYRSPITRAEIESIRGVNCSFTLRNLLLRGLLDRFDNPEDTREYLYRPTVALLEKLGLGRIEDLPQYQELSQDERLTAVLEVDASQSTASSEIEKEKSL